MPEIRRLDLFLSEANLANDAIKLMKIVRPDWDQNIIQTKTFTDGITNKLVGCYLPSNKKNMVLVRVYGQKTELLIDRNREIETFQILFKADCGSELYCTFNNGLCYEYKNGVPLNPQTMSDSSVYRYTAAEMAKMHSISNSGEPPVASLFTTIRKYHQMLPHNFEEPQKNERYSQHVDVGQLGKEMENLEKILKTLDSPVVFCHNDLLCGNAIYDKEAASVTFIDYEYAGYNYQAYDIGNHFCEFPGIVEELDYSLYPEKSLQMDWLKQYLMAWKKPVHPDYEVTDYDLELLYVQVNKFALAAHFFWGIWAFIQAKHSTIDFDFFGYGIQRLAEYFKRKDEFLSLKIPDKPS